ncbi:MAG TPA: NAD(P)/FAD-dependent oxidoreductase [Ktedonobacteraceae bacterium]|nr:NAD(P)/FAD-dependent oxidoreductase [Ktedonobacteraceae bacterium]
MTVHHRYDAIVIGAGPNGLAAAIALAQAGCSVLVFEARETIGGGCRSMELTLPGFVHDICSAIHPLGFNSPFFRTLPLAQYGLEWIHPPIPLAHPLDDGSAVLLERSIDATGDTLGGDGTIYHRFMAPLVASWSLIEQAFLGPLRIPPLLRHPFILGRFGLAALRTAQGLARQLFTGERARALFAGVAAHSMLSLDQPASAAAGILLGASGHVAGWPFPRGGSQGLVNALAAHLQALGGEIVTGVEIKTLASLPPARALLFDVTPRQLLHIAGDHLSHGYRRALRRYRYGPGVFKIDYALDGPIPWKAGSCLRAASVHLGGTLSEIAASEYQVTHDQHPEKPFVLLAQQSLFDETRAPTGKHTVWAYCHVPHGSTFDMAERIEAQIERFAPGFRDRILARHTTDSAAMERYNANYIGGDINGGVQDLRQFFTRPTIRPVPYTTSAKNIFLCSSSTPPGGGVHGMCGYFAAQTALRSVLRDKWHSTSPGTRARTAGQLEARQ